MWIIVGNSAKTERVPGGRRVERQCEKCGEVAMFYERRVTRSFQVFWIDVFDYDQQLAMACGACGALYATDELGAPAAPVDESPIATKVGKAAERAGKAIETGASRVAAWIRGDDIAGSGASASSNASASGSERSGDADESPSTDAHGNDDPLDEEERKLRARFEELERKARERKGS